MGRGGELERRRERETRARGGKEDTRVRWCNMVDERKVS